MSLVINKLKDKIATRGLGTSTGILIQPVTVSRPFKCVVREEEEYYPTTGVFSKSEDIDGWHYDKAPPQDYSNIETTVVTSLGGYLFNLDEGIKETDYQGSCVGCKLLSVNEEYTNKVIWNPEIEVGNYYVNGKEKRLFSKGSICKLVNSATIELQDIWGDGKIATSQIAIFQRDDFFVNSVYKNFNFEIDEDSKRLLVTNYATKQVGFNDSVDASWERIGFANNGGVSYLRYFPIKDLSFNENIAADSYEVDYELGIIRWKATISDKILVKYTAIPRLDLEVVENSFKTSNLNLKPYLYKQSSGIIEISPEERNLSVIHLTSDKSEVSIGAETLLLKATAYNALRKPVDEIDITFEEVDEVFYEGNLKQLIDSTNASGETFARASFPFKDTSSSYFIKSEDVELIEGGTKTLIKINNDVSDEASFEDFYLFEVLKVDPFLGSKGLHFDDVTIVSNEEASKYTITINESELNLEKELYKLNRNDLMNPLTIPKETTVDCFESIYNVGNLKIGNLSCDVVILNVTNNLIEVKINSRIGTIMLNNPIEGATSITLFKKNENEEGSGVERICYTEENRSLLRPVSFNRNGSFRELKYDLPLSKSEIVSGYRIFYPKTKTFRCSGVDPATNRRVSSLPLTIKTTLSDKYKGELQIYNPNDDISRLGGASYLTIDPDTNNTIANLRLIGNEQ